MNVTRFLPAIPTQGFKGNLLKLLSGTTIAQIVGLATMPILTRIYDPDAFGRFGVYYALITIFGALSTGRLELALMLPPSLDDAKKIWKTSFYVLSVSCAAFSAAYGIYALTFDNPLHSLSPLNSWLSVTIGIFFISLAEILIQWHNRQQQYGILASKNIYERLAVVAFCLLFAYLGDLDSGLIWAQNIAIIAVVVYLILTSMKDSPLFKRVRAREALQTIKTYRDFPLKQGWSALFMMAGTQIPVVLFGSTFSMDHAGFINLAFRILEAPVNLLAVSFATTYYQYTSQMSPREMRSVFIRSTRLLVLLLLPVFAVGSVAAPYVFPFLFGQEWTDSGIIAAPLFLLTFFKILYISQGVIFYVLRRLDIDLKISLGFFIAQVVGYFLPLQFTNDMFTIVLVMSGMSSAVFAIGLLMIYRATISSGPSHPEQTAGHHGSDTRRGSYAGA